MRRIYNPLQYEFLQRFEGLNIFITMSAFTLGFAQLIFLFNVFYSMFKGKKAEDNPWQANTVEWTAATPPPHGNFAAIPTVYHPPYEYSRPDAERDWLPQTQPLAAVARNGEGDGA